MKNAEQEMEQRSQELLDTALSRVPFYREYWRRYDPGEGHPAAERFAALPLLTKADMRASFPLGLVDERKNIEQGLDRGEIEYSFTSGTTGEKVINLWSQDWWHASEQASWKLNPTLAALPYPPKQATLASSLNVGISCEEDLPMDHRIMGNLLYLNEKANLICWRSHHLERIAAELNTYQPDVLEANPSLLARACWYWLDHGIEVRSPKVITFTYELPSRIGLKAIQRVFHCPLVSSYGTTETGFVMDTDEEGRYRSNREFCRIDFLPLKEEYGGPSLGRIAVSTFGNPWSCILRFDVGDLVRISPQSGQDGAFTAASVEGRVSNSTFALDGHLITPDMADQAIAETADIRDYDLVQETRDHLTLRLVLNGSRTETVAAAEAAMHRLYGAAMGCTVEAVSDLMPGPSGKYRRVHADFSFDEWALTRDPVILIG